MPHPDGSYAASLLVQAALVLEAVPLRVHEPAPVPHEVLHVWLLGHLGLDHRPELPNHLDPAPHLLRDPRVVPRSRFSCSSLRRSAHSGKRKADSSSCSSAPSECTVSAGSPLAAAGRLEVAN